MNIRHSFLALACGLACTSITAQAASMGPAVIAAGAARLDNGSLVTLGQPFVGVMNAQNGITLSAGILPVLAIATNLPAWPPTICPGAQMQGSVFQFSFRTLSGRNYVVEASTNLVADDWLPIWTNAGSGTSLLFEDMKAAQHPWRFYRLRTP